jgi:hypothetical protein
LDGAPVMARSLTQGGIIYIYVYVRGW